MILRLNNDRIRHGNARRNICWEKTVLKSAREKNMCDQEDCGGDGNAVVASEFRVRARFYAIRQVHGERAYEWYRRVRSAAIPCGFDAGRRAQVVADKFVTGLRPGPVANRLFGERADSRLEDLLVAAVATEEQVEKDEAVDEANPVVTTVPRTTSAEDVLIREIREGLKLYRYSGGDDASNYNDLKSENTKSTFDGNSQWKYYNTIQKNKKKFECNVNNYSPLTCKNCCDLATKLLENFEEKSSSFHQMDKCGNLEVTTSDNYQTSHHDVSKCYCSWLTNDKISKM